MTTQLEADKHKVVTQAVHDAGGNTKYKAGDVVEADELVGADGRSKKKGVEFEPYSFYLSAWEEDQYIIAQANAPLEENGRFVQDRVDTRRAGDFILAPREEIQFIDVSPKQLVSVAASPAPPPIPAPTAPPAIPALGAARTWLSSKWTNSWSWSWRMRAA